MTHSLNSLNQAVSRHVNNAKQITTKDDFAFIKESVVLMVTVDLGVFDKNQKKVLEDCLGIRNSCGHPGKYFPTQLEGHQFISPA